MNSTVISEVVPMEADVLVWRWVEEFQVGPQLNLDEVDRLFP